MPKSRSALITFAIVIFSPFGLCPNLSAALAKSGKRILLVDCDPQQGNATLFLGHNPNGLKITIANVINALLVIEYDVIGSYMKK